MDRLDALRNVSRPVAARTIVLFIATGRARQRTV